MNIGARIREIRKKQGMLQETLASKVGVNTVTLSYWENGKREVKPSMLEKIAAALSVSVTTFYHDSQEDLFQRAKSAISAPVSDAPGIAVPIVAFVKCGALADARDFGVIDETTEYITITEDEIRGYNKKDVFFTVAEGDSMEPEVREGDRVLLVSTDVAYHGDMVCALFTDTDEITIKWFAVRNGEYFLVPENKKYPALPLKKREFRIVAKALKVHRIVNFPKKRFSEL